ncbi:MAG TPA: amidohydrolase family protein [Dehalococcoidia bacterium]|nr:amidohydrolase family protein [Dehalococcoidia bacterium]
MAKFPIVSADDHIDLQWLPPDLWTSRVPASLRDRVPRVKGSAMGDMWYLGDQVLAPYGSPAMGGGLRSGLERGEAVRQGEFRPTTPKLRLEDMARDGVSASVMYGPVSPLATSDPDIRQACFRAYNEWLADFCRAAPSQFVGVGLIPHDDPQQAAEEIYHLADLKLPEAAFLAARVPGPLFEAQWEPLWAAAEETGTIVGLHLGGGARTLTDQNRAASAAHMGTYLTIVQMKMDEAIASVVMGGVLERHPGLKVVMAETGIGWLPYILQRMEHSFDRLKDSEASWQAKGGIPLTLRPTEYFRRQVWATFQEDKAGIALLDWIGEERVMWASDYPHPDGTWPDSQRVIQEQFGDLSEATRRKILGGNARALYNLPEGAA